LNITEAQNILLFSDIKAMTLVVCIEFILHRPYSL